MKRTLFTLTAALALSLAVPAAYGGEPVAPVSKPATGPALRHVFLAVDESRQQIHYVDQNDPARYWSVTTIQNEKPFRIRDIALAGAQRLLMAGRDGQGIFILDLQSRQYWRIMDGGGCVQPTLTGVFSDGRLLTRPSTGRLVLKTPIENARPIYQVASLADGDFLVAIGYGAAQRHLHRPGY